MPIRLRLVLLAVIAILAMGVAVWLGFGQLHDSSVRLEREAERNRWSHDCSTLIHYLQRERGASASYIAASLTDLEALKKMRADTNGAFDRLLENPLAEESRLSRLGLGDLRVKLMEVRQDVDRQRIEWRRARDAYTNAINSLLGAVSFELLRDTDTISLRLDAIAELALARESLGLLRATINSLRQHTQRETTDLIYVASEFTLYRQHVDRVSEMIHPSGMRAMQAALASADYQWTFGTIGRFLSQPKGVLVLEDANAWWSRSTHVIDALKVVEEQLFADLALETEQKIRSQKQFMMWVAILTSVLLVVLVSFVAFTITRMMQDLKALALALDQIVDKENYAIRLKDRGDKDELSHAFKLFNRLLEFTDKLIREKETLAAMDSLTGVMNRRAFTKYAQREMSRATRYKSRLSMLFLDIDHFKQVNDNHGHAVGDQVLKLFVDTLRQRIRNTDLIARWGGEEFIILAPETGMPEALSFAESLRKAVLTVKFPGVGQLSCSVGVTECRPGESFDEMSARADAALYQAKSAGRNRICAG